MTINKSQLYYIAAVLAAIAAILQFLNGGWFRGVTTAVLAAAMVLAGSGFPEKSVTNRRIYFGIIGLVIVLMFARLIGRVG